MDIRTILKIIIVILLISIQVYHIENEGFVKYPCISWGRSQETPFITIAWIVIILISLYIVLKNNKIDRKSVYIGFILIILLIVSSNLDYSQREEEDETNTYTYIHHALSFICMIYSFIIVYKYYPIYMRYIIIFLLLSFFTLHQSWYIINYNEGSKSIIKKTLTVLELIIIIIIKTKLLNIS
jgi:hypothetical protein